MQGNSQHYEYVEYSLIMYIKAILKYQQAGSTPTVLFHVSLLLIYFEVMKVLLSPYFFLGAWAPLGMAVH